MAVWRWLTAEEAELVAADVLAVRRCFVGVNMKVSSLEGLAC